MATYNPNDAYPVGIIGGLVSMVLGMIVGVHDSSLFAVALFGGLICVGIHALCYAHPQPQSKKRP